LLDRTLSHVRLAAGESRRIVERLIAFRRLATLLADVTRDRLAWTRWESALRHY